ncbi:hypothetical protein [Caballeronia telluris]|uniref:hypothetical protein n=1 Tax=Caballeronia telluris TaxID=326475 RepID=UPI001F3D1353|nr:hypothetical protein [Caballeronia telluris]
MQARFGDPEHRGQRVSDEAGNLSRREAPQGLERERFVERHHRTRARRHAARTGLSAPFERVAALLHLNKPGCRKPCEMAIDRPDRDGFKCILHDALMDFWRTEVVALRCPIGQDAHDFTIEF